MVLDSHQLDDNRINKHLITVEKRYDVIRININFYPGRPGVKHSERVWNKEYTTFQNPYLNGLTFTIATALGKGISRLESDLRESFINDDDKVIFHVHDPYLLGLGVKLCKRFDGSKIVYDRHEYYETWKNRLGFSAPGIFERLYGGRVAEVIFVSRQLDRLPKIFSGKNISVIPNYPQSLRFNREVIVDKLDRMDLDSGIEVVYFGVLNLNFDRDLRGMFDIMRSVMEKMKNVSFTVAGRLFDEEVRSIMDSLVSDFGERVTYLGEIPYDEVIRRMQRAHLGFFMLRPDSHMWREDQPVSPNKVYEYMLSGTIPIIRATLDDHDVINKCSLTFDRSASKEEILYSVLELVGNKERMKRMMMDCFDASREYTWEKVSNRYLECYERLFLST